MIALETVKKVGAASPLPRRLESLRKQASSESGFGILISMSQLNRTTATESV
ncbi:hypothetical protein BMJ34_24120 [Sinorhizobium medicae]|uniref:Uncharacterized protein n=1 Tax=Sinorhizobium medicae TaxID=110321 RepID=A0ABX4TD27_9HYPH|nr:hypothetical protein [Sinorhizobium medicae]MDX0633624.1 hypothetical protein [Sinorhizobium medicae]MDX0769667.1 hypothetical protein [Sinorhizobium medicae]MDX0904081.1 hypothetical protein [Sinorhizobium medicae]MDX1161898.1 hypothetical protein [Sinorhizobium medicae]